MTAAMFTTSMRLNPLDHHPHAVLPRRHHPLHDHLPYPFLLCSNRTQASHTHYPRFPSTEQISRRRRHRLPCLLLRHKALAHPASSCTVPTRRRPNAVGSPGPLYTSPPQPRFPLPRHSPRQHRRMAAHRNLLWVSSSRVRTKCKIKGRKKEAVMMTTRKIFAHR